MQRVQAPALAVDPAVAEGGVEGLVVVDGGDAGRLFGDLEPEPGGGLWLGADVGLEGLGGREEDGGERGG